jgi:hypothetical protein
MDDRCAKARLIHAECRRLTRGSRRLARRADLFRRRDERVSALKQRQDRPEPPIPGVSREPVSAVAYPPASGDRALAPAAVAASVAMPDADSGPS